jgi:hypothetical protein
VEYVTAGLLTVSFAEFLTVTCVDTESSVSNVTASVSNATLVIVGAAVGSPQANRATASAAGRKRNEATTLIVQCGILQEATGGVSKPAHGDDVATWKGLT